MKKLLIGILLATGLLMSGCNRRTTSSNISSSHSPKPSTTTSSTTNIPSSSSPLLPPITNSPNTSSYDSISRTMN